MSVYINDKAEYLKPCIIADKRYIRNNLNKARLIGILIIIVLSFYSLYTVINSHSYLPYHSILS